MSRTHLLFVFATAFVTLAAGCVTTPEDDAQAATVEPDGLLVDVLPLSYDGEIGLRAVVCPVVACVDQSPSPGERWFDTEVAPGTYALNLTMTWEAASPKTAELLLGIFRCDPEDCAPEDGDLEYVAGASPLTFQTDGFSVSEGEVLYVFANDAGVGAGPVFARASTPQAFHIEGTLAPVWEANETTA